MAERESEAYQEAERIERLNQIEAYLLTGSFDGVKGTMRHEMDR